MEFDIWCDIRRRRVHVQRVEKTAWWVGGSSVYCFYEVDAGTWYMRALRLLQIVECARWISLRFHCRRKSDVDARHSAVVCVCAAPVVMGYTARGTSCAATSAMHASHARLLLFYDSFICTGSNAQTGQHWVKQATAVAAGRQQICVVFWAERSNTSYQPSHEIRIPFHTSSTFFLLIIFSNEKQTYLVFLRKTNIILMKFNYLVCHEPVENHVGIMKYFI